MNQLIQVSLEYIGNEKVGQYDPYIPVLFKSGEDKYWKNYAPNHNELAVLRKLPKGTTLQLAPAGTTQSGKPKYTVIIPESEAESPKPPTGKTPEETKRAMVTAIDELTGVWAHCYQKAGEKLNEEGESVPPEAIRCCASSTFIQVTQRFLE